MIDLAELVRVAATGDGDRVVVSKRWLGAVAAELIACRAPDTIRQRHSEGIGG